MPIDPQLYRRKHAEIVETLKTKAPEIIAMVGVDGSQTRQMVVDMLRRPGSVEHAILLSLTAILAVVLVENG